jgi:hypothetical protein
VPGLERRPETLQTVEGTTLTTLKETGSFIFEPKLHPLERFEGELVDSIDALNHSFSTPMSSSGHHFSPSRF